MTATNPVGLELADLCYPRSEVPDDRDDLGLVTTTPEGAVSAQPAPSAPVTRPTVEDMAWRGHSHGSERTCGPDCWSESLQAAVDKKLNPERERCAQCGRVARGSADIDGKRYCHGSEKPSCYEREQWSRSGVAPSAPDFAEVTIWLTRDALADLLPLFDGFAQARVRYVDSLPDLGDES